MPVVDAELLVADAEAWRAWLTKHHASSDGVWLVVWKKASNASTSLSIADALDEALCHGWIDGQRLTRDDGAFMQRFTPRRPHSMWSKRNISIIARLEQEGRMQDAGRAEVARAKADGRWHAAYAGPADMTAPDDLVAALDARPRARAMYDILTSQNRFSISFRVGQAKKPETRVRRIEQFIAQLERGETIHPQRRTMADGEPT